MIDEEEDSVDDDSAEDEDADGEGARDYLHDMLKQLAIMAAKCGERFIADSLTMVLKEAQRVTRHVQ